MEAISLVRGLGNREYLLQPPLACTLFTAMRHLCGQGCLNDRLNAIPLLTIVQAAVATIGGGYKACTCVPCPSSSLQKVGALETANLLLDG